MTGYKMHQYKTLKGCKAAVRRYGRLVVHWYGWDGGWMLLRRVV